MSTLERAITAASNAEVASGEESDTELELAKMLAMVAQAEAATRQAEALEKIANTLAEFHTLARAIVLLRLFGRLLPRLWALRGERN